MFCLRLSILESTKGILERVFPLSWKRIKGVNAFFFFGNDNYSQECLWGGQQAMVIDL